MVTNALMDFIREKIVKAKREMMVAIQNFLHTRMTGGQVMPCK